MLWRLRPLRSPDRAAPWWASTARVQRQHPALPALNWPAETTVDDADDPECVTLLLAAVYADIVGYSRLFGRDDRGTVARLQRLRRDRIAPTLERHGGVAVQSAGDSMLILFQSVAQAVRGAVAIQHEMFRENEGQPLERQMQMRIGVDLGDIIMDGHDFHGDGVIVAARLQALCPPGGVCVSRTVYDRGGERLGLRSEALGAVALKNVARLVEAFVLWPAHAKAPDLVSLAHDDAT